MYDLAALLENPISSTKFSGIMYTEVIHSIIHCEIFFLTQAMGHIYNSFKTIFNITLLNMYDLRCDKWFENKWKQP